MGTKTRLIKFRKGKITTKKWGQFTGNIKLTSKGLYGNLELELKNGKIRRFKNRSHKFIPEIIYIIGIKNVFDVEKKIRTRIQEYKD